MTRRSAGTIALAAAAIVLLALTLRIAVASLSPLLTRIGEEFPLPAVVVGLIGMAPPVAFALAGMVTPAIERRLGLERSVLVAAITAAVMLGLRAAAVDAWSLLGATAGVFAAVGVANVLIPTVVKKYFPERIGLMTTVYSTAMAVATFTPPLVAVPLADAVGWRGSFVTWAVVALAAVAPWAALNLRARASRRDALDEPRTAVLSRLVRVPQTWALVITFGVNSSVAYGMFAWMPPLLVDVAGVDAAEAGGLLALFSFMGLPVSLLVPLLVARLGRTTPFYVVAVGCGLTGVVGLIAAPATATVLWVVLIGIPPLMFPLALVLFGLRTRSHETTVALSGFVQSVGYAFAALMPLAIGLTHEVTGGWIAGLSLLGVALLIVVPAAIVMVRGESVEEAWERRTGLTWQRASVLVKPVEGVGESRLRLGVGEVRRGAPRAGDGGGSGRRGVLRPPSAAFRRPPRLRHPER